MNDLSNDEIARIISREVVNGGDYSLVTTYIATDYRYHGIGGMAAAGPEGFASAIREFRTALPDLRSEIKNIVSEGDFVVLRFDFTGTHAGPFLGIAATGKTVHFEGMIMRRFRNSQVIEDWDFFDMPTVLKQIQE